MYHSDDVIDIQIPYNLNQLIEIEYWNGSFHPISLHGLLDHFPSDLLNIKKLLICMAKYIKNTKINISKSNNVLELRGIGESTWRLFLAIYNSE